MFFLNKSIFFQFITLYVLFFISLMSGELLASDMIKARNYTDSWSITMGGIFSTRLIRHNEVSTTSGYSSINEVTRLDEISFSFAVLKEFMSQERISFTVKALGGLLDDSSESDGDNLSVFKEDLSGYQWGAGLSVNYNIYYYGLKLQPYIGVDLVQESGKYNLTHTSSSAELTTRNEFTGQIAILCLGLRAYDS